MFLQVSLLLIIQWAKYVYVEYILLKQRNFKLEPLFLNYVAANKATLFGCTTNFPFSEFVRLQIWFPLTALNMDENLQDTLSIL